MWFVHVWDYQKVTIQKVLKQVTQTSIPIQNLLARQGWNLA